MISDVKTPAEKLDGSTPATIRDESTARKRTKTVDKDHVESEPVHTRGKTLPCRRDVSVKKELHELRNRSNSPGPSSDVGMENKPLARTGRTNAELFTTDTAYYVTPFVIDSDIAPDWSITDGSNVVGQKPPFYFKFVPIFDMKIS